METYASNSLSWQLEEMVSGSLPAGVLPLDKGSMIRITTKQALVLQTKQIWFMLHVG